MLALYATLAGCGEPGDLSAEQLSRVVAAQQPTLKRCYDAALERAPSKTELRLTADITVAPTGQVSAVEIAEREGEVTLPGLNACLRDAILGWRFPQAREATEATLPLILKPEVVPSGPTLDDVQKTLRDIRERQQKPEAQPSTPQPLQPQPDRPPSPGSQPAPPP